MDAVLDVGVTLTASDPPTPAPLPASTTAPPSPASTTAPPSPASTKPRPITVQRRAQEEHERTSLCAVRREARHGLHEEHGLSACWHDEFTVLRKKSNDTLFGAQFNTSPRSSCTERISCQFFRAEPIVVFPGACVSACVQRLSGVDLGSEPFPAKRLSVKPNRHCSTTDTRSDGVHIDLAVGFHPPHTARLTV